MKREVWPGNEDGASGALPDPRLARALPFSLPDLNLHPLGSAERRKPGAGSWGGLRGPGAGLEATPVMRIKGSLPDATAPRSTPDPPHGRQSG